MVHRFGIFEFDADSSELRKNGRAVALEPQPAKALALLLSRAGDVVTREELRDAVWGQDTHVDFDRGLAYCVSQIRTALGDSGDNPRFVQTIPKRGFKFIAPVARHRRRSPVAPVHAVARRSQLGRPSPLTIARACAAVGRGWCSVDASRRRPSTEDVVTSRCPSSTTKPATPNTIGSVAGLSDLVVERLTQARSDRLAVDRQRRGPAAAAQHPQPEGRRESVKADYVLLGQLQKGESGLRFITHFIRLSDEAHLKANRLTMADGS